MAGICPVVFYYYLPYHMFALSSPASLYRKETEPGPESGRIPGGWKTRWDQKEINVCKSQ